MTSRIIIIGGGFAGVMCARTLRKKLPPESWQIVLFSRENSMVFYPLLAEVAGAAINLLTVAVLFRQVLPNIRCRTEEVLQIDLATSEVEYEGYDDRPARMAFDHAVLACGAAVNLTMVPGMAGHAFPLKSVGDAVALRFHVMNQLEKAEVCADPERLRWYLSFVVVGGGFSGVEVVGEINDLVRTSLQFYRNFTSDDVSVTLVHTRNQILPEVSPLLREFDWLPVVENRDSRRLIGIIRSKRILRYPCRPIGAAPAVESPRINACIGCRLTHNATRSFSSSTT